MKWKEVLCLLSRMFTVCLFHSLVNDWNFDTVLAGCLMLKFSVRDDWAENILETSSNMFFSRKL